MIITVADQDKNLCRYARYAETPPYASGWQIFKYGKLGEVVENIRTFTLPFENQTYTFKMQYEYDSWNRIQKMTYPDGEEVYYEYNLGGMLEKVYGQVKVSEPLIPVPHRDGEQGTDGVMRGGEVPWIIPEPGPFHPGWPTVTYTYPYIDSIAYNEFELKSEVFYGNGTHTQYGYDSIQRLHVLQSQTRAGIDMQDITYTYDAVSNITCIFNAANYPGMNLGGTYSHSYEYDDLYRLTYSTGTWEDRPYHLGLVDTVRMAYHKNGRIARKNVFALTMSPTQMGVTNYNRRYDYSGQRNTLSDVYDSVTNTSQNFSWDNCGNMLSMEVASDNFKQNIVRTHTWTEDNRLQTVTDNEWFSYYQYDAGGDRTYKLPYNRTISNRSGRISYYWAAGDATLYASPYLVVTPKGYTKHYYAESERITSQIGRGNFSTLTTPVTDLATANRKVRRADSLVLALNPSITDTTAQLSFLSTLTNRQKDTCEAYWYHTDHLGSSSWVTDSAGNPVQHLHYLPWGEDFVNQRLNSFEGARYTFSAKERDTETGYSYFGARYYSSDLSIWLSVDPQSDKYPSFSPYVYCANNPIKLVDPNGEAFSDPPWKTIKPVVSKEKFVGYQRGQQCYALAKKQLNAVGYTCGGYYESTTHQAYTENNGVNRKETSNAVQYIHNALEQNIPVLAGVDDSPGNPGNHDKTTDHYIVIVGQGNDENGNYFNFYDNATSNIEDGTSENNKLYYDSKSGKITGKSQNNYARNCPRDYTLTHIRESKALKPKNDD